MFHLYVFWIIDVMLMLWYLDCMKAVMRFVVFGLSSLLGIPGGGGGGGSSLNGSRKHWIFLCRAHFNLRHHSVFHRGVLKGCKWETSDKLMLEESWGNSGQSPPVRQQIKLYMTPSYAAYIRNIALGRTKQTKRMFYSYPAFPLILVNALPVQQL